MVTKYVVMQQGYEYNDEINVLSEGESGYPVHIFSDKTLAEKTARERSLNFLKHNNLREFGYELEDVLKVEVPTFLKEWTKTTGEEVNEDTDEFTLPDNVTLRKAQQLLKMISFEPYFVMNVEE